MRRGLLGLAATCIALLAFTGSAFAASTGMSVSGSKLLKDGHPFRLHGFNMVGALAPQWCNNGAFVTARSYYGPTELNTLVGAWHANAVRLQVSQEGLGDTANYSSTQISDYLSQIESDVQTARSLGLVVILSMQDQGGGCGLLHQLPDATTVAAWNTLAPAFAGDPDVMFELFNEPQNNYSASSQWAQWQNGGSSPLCNAGTTSTCSTAVGYQTLVNDIRGLGANNVLLADGANNAEHFDGVGPYLLSDSPSGRGIAYAVHPYYFNPSSSFPNDETYYKNAYGFLVGGGHAVVATEWNYVQNQCSTDAPTLAPQFLTWLEKEGIGMTAMAGDYPGQTIADWNWDPTYCGGPVGGSGQQLMAWYQHLVQAPAAPSVAVTTTTPTSLTVSWTKPASTFALAGYDVSLNGAYKRTTFQLSTKIGGLACGTTYTVGVDARDIMGNLSPTTTVTATTAACS